MLTTEAVVAEVRPAAAKRYLEQLQAMGKLDLAEPGAETLVRVLRVAKQTGDSPGLSITDIGLLALALERRARLVTSDHRMQNVAQALKLTFIPTTEGAISKQWRWGRRCTGCRKHFGAEQVPSDQQCPICGHPLGSVRVG